LGPNARYAYDFYKTMGDRFWAIRAQDKKVLSVVKRCYAIAAENANLIAQVCTNQESPIKQEMLKNLQ